MYGPVFVCESSDRLSLFLHMFGIPCLCWVTTSADTCLWQVAMLSMLWEKILENAWCNSQRKNSSYVLKYHYKRGLVAHSLILKSVPLNSSAGKYFLHTKYVPTQTHNNYVPTQTLSSVSGDRGSVHNQNIPSITEHRTDPKTLPYRVGGNQLCKPVFNMFVTRWKALQTVSIECLCRLLELTVSC